MSGGPGCGCAKGTFVENEEIAAIDVYKEIAEFPLTPYPGRLYVKEDEVLKFGRIHIPETSRKEGEMQTNMGFVVAVAADVTFVKTGDRILYARFSGAWVLGQKYRVMNEEDILGRFK
jgi:co-chaperonin GroES (HSP10)